MEGFEVCTTAAAMSNSLENANGCGAGEMRTGHADNGDLPKETEDKETVKLRPSTPPSKTPSTLTFLVSGRCPSRHHQSNGIRQTTDISAFVFCRIKNKS